MSFVAPPPLRRFMWRSANSMLAALLLAGCQSYEPAPLDMNAFDASPEHAGEAGVGDTK